MNQEFFLKNIKSFPKSTEEMTTNLQKIEADFEYEILPCKSGDLTLKIIKDGKSVLFHSAYRPLDEAKKILESDFNQPPDLLVLGGFGMGYLLEAAISLFPNVPILLCEKDNNIFKIALQNRDLSNVLSHPNIRILVTDEMETILDVIQSYKGKKVGISIHRPSLLLYSDYYANLKKMVLSYVNTQEININTLNRFEKLWSKNILRNAIDFIENPGVGIGFDKFKDIPCVIVAAGPSLNKHLSLLKETRKNYIMIACDTVYQILLRNGIDPDIVVAVDPQDINQKYFYNVSGSSAILVCEPSISNKIVRRYPNNQYMMSSVFPLAKWLENISNPKGDIDIGGSVATAAYGLGYQLGCNPIIFAGLDLAYTAKSTHVKGAYFEQIWFYQSHRLQSPINLEQNFFSKQDLIEIKGYYGDTVLTDRKFLMFLWWFEGKFIKATDRIILDCTEGGSFKKNCQQMSLSEALQTYCKQPIPINIPSFFKMKKEPKYSEKLKNEIVKSIDVLQIVENISDQAITHSKKLYDLVYKSIVNKKPKPSIVNHLLKELDSIDQEIRKQQNLTQLLSLSLQKIIHQILDNLDIGLSDMEKENDELKIARKSWRLYEEINNASQFINWQLRKTLKRFSYKN